MARSQATPRGRGEGAGPPRPSVTAQPLPSQQRAFTPVSKTPMKTLSVPAGNSAGTGVNPSLNNPWGAKLTSGPGNAPNAKPEPPPLLVQMGGLPATPVSATPGVASKKKGGASKPRTGDEA